MLRLILSVVVLVAGAGGAALLRTPPPHPPAHVKTVQLAAVSVPDLHGAVRGVVEAIAPGALTLRVAPAALPAGIAATTTGGSLVNAVLPIASGAKTFGTLTVGAQVEVVVSNGAVTAVAVLPVAVVTTQPARPDQAAPPEHPAPPGRPFMVMRPVPPGPAARPQDHQGQPQGPGHGHRGR